MFCEILHTDFTEMTAWFAAAMLPGRNPTATGLRALQLLHHLSADKIFIEAKCSASACVKLSMD